MSVPVNGQQKDGRQQVKRKIIHHISKYRLLTYKEGWVHQEIAVMQANVTQKSKHEVWRTHQQSFMKLLRTTFIRRGTKSSKR